MLGVMNIEHRENSFTFHDNQPKITARKFFSFFGLLFGTGLVKGLRPITASSRLHNWVFWRVIRIIGVRAGVVD
jgi:hypothetical protein